jgi:hypothetical protein
MYGGVRGCVQRKTSHTVFELRGPNPHLRVSKSTFSRGWLISWRIGMTAPAQPPRLTSDELAQALAHVLDTIGRIRGRNLDLYGVSWQLQPCQVDVMHLYNRAVAAELLPRWIQPPDPSADDTTLLHAWAALAALLPSLYPGEVMAIKTRAGKVLDLPGGGYKVAMRDEDVPMLIEHAESIVRLMLSKPVVAPTSPQLPAAPPLTLARDPAPPRLGVDVKSSVIHLDGHHHPVSDKQARAVQYLLDARGGWVSSTTMKDFPDSDQRPDRWIRGLPAPVLALIEGKTGAGYRLTIPVE